MNAVRKIIEKYTNSLTINLPEEYENKKVEIIVLPLEENQPEDSGLSKFFGKLEWKGDALAEQRKLRDEWD